jgi:ribonuclease BN (tRNA processing enzyme)
MHLRVLGCGTILQRGQSSNCSGYLLDHHLLFDCGPGVWKSLNEQSISLNQITHIILTHFHVDHTSDIGPLLLNRLLLPDINNVPLTIIGPPGLTEWFSHLKLLLGSWSEDVSVNLYGMKDQPHQTGDYKIIAKSTGHTENSICFRVDKDGTSFFYSGDTGYSENVITLSEDCHLAIIEASNTTETKIEEHLTPGLAGRIAEQAGIQKLVLTHMYPEVREGDPVKEASFEFSGEIIVAEDGMSLEF